MDDIFITASGVSKKFCKSLKRSMLYGMQDIIKNIAGPGFNGCKLRRGEFWAVHEVSFELQRGECVGLIGPNGSGKSTLLKLLNGILIPDTGAIKVKGRVGALIELGAGFHPMLTGRENIYVNGVILGMKKTELDNKFDAIVDFAEIHEFIDTPVKNYSSGMFARLGFAVAVHCEPDILLVDEVLAVGDKDFQIKCFQKIHEIKKNGAIIIIVSHNEYTICDLTRRCLYMRGGALRYFGPTDTGVNLYIKEMLESRSAPKIKQMPGAVPVVKKATLCELAFYDQTETAVSFVESGQELRVVLECIIHEELSAPVFGINFYGENNFMYCANTEYEQINVEKCAPGRLRIKICFPHFHLPAGNYTCSTVIAEESPSNLIDWHDRQYKLVVGRPRNARGSIKLATRWELDRIC
jgi:lipopolysaccharide transport system ATP-binding protein